MGNDVGSAVRDRDFYARAAKAIIKDVRVDKGLSYKALARLLEAQGTRMDVQVLINRVNHGKFSFAFALQLLSAMGVEHLVMPRLGARFRQPGTKTPPG